ncbi:hypothetical protein F0562_017075 [Nyssa sinensis]|uniref:Nuclear transcription factor Y subunit n=1 Tax=Nyssa sinensis TaxID=561372 RepID=A0A5J4ZDX3_9ASTE|nr:hypothetical protein F0562_017075 [Nyssa sinensis]
MPTMCFKDNEGIVQNPIGTLSSVPWWSGLASQSVYGESFGQLKPTSGDQLTATKQSEHGTDQGLEKGCTTQFTIFPENRQKPPQLQTAISLQTAPPEYQGHFELGSGQPMICAKYPCGDQCYGVFSTYGSQITGRIMLPLTSHDGPIYVNAKQYHGIIRRRKSRAKAEMKNKVLRDRKPYLHLSRHLHAMRRPRGCGGRFLNLKNLNCDKGGTDMKMSGDGKFCQPTGSQNSEVLQYDSGNLNSPKETNGSSSNHSGSEVTSMYSRGDLDCFPINILRKPAHSLSHMMNTGHSIVMPSKWGTAADNCCNLKV